MSYTILQNQIITKYKENGYDELYKNDNDANLLIQGISQANSFETILNYFKDHSVKVAKDLSPPDYLNGCDNNDSPLSLLIYTLLEPENSNIYQNYLYSIQTENEYLLNEWILMELNMLLFTNPINYYNQTIQFINHPIIGKKFSFWAGCWINSCYYLENDINMDLVDENYLAFFNIYTDLYFHNKSNNKSNKTNYLNYCKSILKDLKFRDLTKYDLPKFISFLTNELN